MPRFKVVHPTNGSRVFFYNYKYAAKYCMARYRSDQYNYRGIVDIVSMLVSHPMT